MILVYIDMFLKLKDISEGSSFKEADANNDGTIFPKDFKEKLENSKKYSRYSTFNNCTLFIHSFPIFILTLTA